MIDKVNLSSLHRLRLSNIVWRSIDDWYHTICVHSIARLLIVSIHTHLIVIYVLIFSWCSLQKEFQG